MAAKKKDAGTGMVFAPAPVQAGPDELGNALALCEKLDKVRGRLPGGEPPAWFAALYGQTNEAAITAARDIAASLGIDTHEPADDAATAA